jgi:acyl carrier protein
MTRDDIFSQVKSHLVTMFALDADAITMGASLQQDLDLDSLDAIDLAAKLEQLTGKRVEEESLRNVRSVSDVVDMVERSVSKGPT